MKKTTLRSLFLGFALVSSTLPAQAAGDDPIPGIRQKYEQIEGKADLKKDSFEFACEDGPGSGTVTRWRDASGNVLKVTLDHSAGDHGGYETSFYFDGNETIFVFQKAFSWRFDGENPDGSSKTRDTLRERRYYFHQRVCVRMLEREVDSADANELETLITKAENREAPAEDAAEVLAEATAVRGMGTAAAAVTHFCGGP